MNPRRRIPRIFLVIAAATPTGLHADSPRLRLTPQPWTDNGRPFRDLMEQPGQWAETRSRLTAISYYAWALNNQFTDAELGAWFTQIQGWSLELDLEVGVIKEWQADASAMFAFEKPLYDRFIGLGAQLGAFAMDEPFWAVRNFNLGTNQYAVDQTAEWIALVRANYPGTKIFSIEPYPSFSVADLQWWITSLNQKLADMLLDPIDFFVLDVDWTRFPPAVTTHWQNVKTIEMFCRQNNVPFSMIYWGSDFEPDSTDADWYTGVLSQGAAYQQHGGQPDEYLIQSWLTIPVSTVPETGPFTFTRSVRDFADAFLYADPDGDGVISAFDNCVHAFNPDQADADADTVGDLCDNCPDVYNPTQKNTDDDNVGNACDLMLPGDFDSDGDVDGIDFLTFSNCFNGSGNPPRPLCPTTQADLSGDGDVDGFDFLFFSTCFNGANNPPRPCD